MNIQEQEERDFCVSISRPGKSTKPPSGCRWPDREWLLTDQDVWVRNPHYVGVPGRHPEDWPEDDESGEHVEAAPSDELPF